ncbi:MAG: T9SS type A sorting domain-containing protein, partial [Bacteroidota bacterium]
SNDDGNTWTQVNNGLTNTNVSTLTTSGTRVYAGTFGGVFSSIDNGTNWTAKNTGLTDLDVMTITMYEEKVFAGTDGGGIFYSSDTGNTWTAANTGLTSFSVFASAISGSSIFAGTKGGGVFKRPLGDFGISAGINKTSTNTAQVNIYPNPFSISSTIEIKGNSGTGKMDLVIYGLLGQEVKRIKNIKGKTATIDRVNLPDGAYFYKLLQDNKQIATGKFIAE